MFVDDECVYRISIKGMKEMEKGGKREMETWFFSKEKALSFHTKEWLHSLGTLKISRVWSILI